MSQDEMTFDKAKQIMEDTAKARDRWGPMFTWPHNKTDVLDAMVVLMEVGADKYDERKEELTKANRQLAASKARETKLKKQIEELKDKVKYLEDCGADLQGG